MLMIPELVSISTVPSDAYEIAWRDTELNLDGQNLVRFTVMGESDAYLAFTSRPYDGK